MFTDCIPKQLRSWRFWIETYCAVSLSLLSPLLIKWGTTSFPGLWMGIESLLEGNNIFNYLTATACLILIVRFCYERWCCHGCSWHIVIWLSVAIVYCLQPPVGRIEIYGGGCYSWLFVAGSVIAIMIELLKLLPDDEAKDTDNAFLLSVKEHFYDGREEFAKSLSHRISVTQGEEAFAIGITGVWGSGKTSFLNYIDKNIGTANDFKVWFYPWNSNTPDNIILDFFESLSGAISPFNGSLKRSLKRYASLLVGGAFNDETTRLGELVSTLTGGDDSLESLKKHLNETIASFPGRIYVFIDDMDRLDKDEIMQVLKLIRNTANFTNMTYIVAFDRGYIIETIDNGGIGRANDFIEKIFHLEIALPQIEEHALPRLIWSHISPLTNDRPRIRRELAQILLNQDEVGYRLPRYLTNYRQALRFINVMSNHILFLKEHNRLKKLDFTELFWLEVLRYRYPDIYEQLSYHKEAYLILSKKSDRYKIKEDVSIKDTNLEWLLKKLFDQEPISSNSISYAHNFGHYFALRVYDNHLSSNEFADALKNGETLCDTIEMWIQQRPSLRESLIFNFKNYKFEFRNVDSVRNYIDALAYWTTKTADKEAVNLYAEKFDSRHISVNHISTIKQSLKESLLGISLPPDKLDLKIKIIKALRPDYDIDEHHYVERHLLFPDEFIELMTKTLREVDKISPLIPEDVFNEKNLLHQLLEASAVIIDVSPDGIINCHDQLMWPTVFELLKSKPKGTSLKDTLHEFASGYWVGEEDFEYEAYHDKIGRLFGDDKTCREFCIACFEGSDEEKQLILRQYNIN